MDPDEEYEILKKKGYFKEHTMSRETLKAINELEKSVEKRIDDLKDSFHTEMKTKLDIKDFNFTVKLFVTIMIVIMGYIVYEIRIIRSESSDTKDLATQTHAQIKNWNLDE
jgi:hypothetical protein